MLGGSDPAGWWLGWLGWYGFVWFGCSLFFGVTDLGGVVLRLALRVHVAGSLLACGYCCLLPVDRWLIACLLA